MEFLESIVCYCFIIFGNFITITNTYDAGITAFYLLLPFYHYSEIAELRDHCRSITYQLLFQVDGVVVQVPPHLGLTAWHLHIPLPILSLMINDYDLNKQIELIAV